MGRKRPLSLPCPEPEPEPLINADGAASGASTSTSPSKFRRMNAVCLEGSGRLHVPSVPNHSSSSSGLDIVVHVDSMEPSSVSNHRDDQDSIVCDTLPDEDSDHQPPPETRGSIPPEEREARLRQAPDEYWWGRQHENDCCCYLCRWINGYDEDWIVI